MGLYSVDSRWAASNRMEFRPPSLLLVPQMLNSNDQRLSVCFSPMLTEKEGGTHLSVLLIGLRDN